jgi:acyl-coenzyme A synthetase/AMP-(fatty) acid ligase
VGEFLQQTMLGVNFQLDVVDSAPAERLALIALGRDGSRTEIPFGEVSDRSARLAGTLAAHGVRPGDVVMTLIGNRPEWVYAIVACSGSAPWWCCATGTSPATRSPARSRIT